MSFGNKWIKPQTDNKGIKILEGIRPQSPLKPRIEDAQKKLEIQISKLDNISVKTIEKDQVVFKRIVQAVQNHEVQYAKVLSGELAQIRKMGKMVNSAKLALEQIHLRLNTITELGDVVVTLSPAMSVIKGIQGKLSTMMPEADQSLTQISDLLGNIVGDTGQLPNTEINNVKLSSEDSMKIIEEATAIVEQSMKEKFPDLPSINLNAKNEEASVY